MANDKKTVTYDYQTEINQDMKGNKEELENLLKKWEESNPSELRDRMIQELTEEINS